MTLSGKVRRGCGRPDYSDARGGKDQALTCPTLPVLQRELSQLAVHQVLARLAVNASLSPFTNLISPLPPFRPPAETHRPSYLVGLALCRHD